MTGRDDAAGRAVTTGPGRHHLLFDGDCGICTWAAAAFGRMDGPREYVIAPFQDYDDAALATLGVTREQCARAVQVVTPAGRVHRGAFGINYVLWRRMPWTIVVALVYAIPVLLVSELLLYRVVANQRHRLSRWLGLQACRVAPAATKRPGRERPPGPT
jgi:predicted DCC family thiol-disulfide oxidoreductase YuxK